MKTRIISVLLTLIVLLMPSICAAYILKNQLSAASFPSYITKQLYLAPYTRVVINAPMDDVQIIPNSTSSVQLRGDAISIQYLKTVVVDKTLYINVLHHSNKVFIHPVSIKMSRSQISQIVAYRSGNITAWNLTGPLSVWSNSSSNIYLYGCNLDLQYLQVTGSGSVFVKGINSCSLSIYANGPGQIELAGTAVLRSVRYYGSGTLSLYWIDSPYVSIYAGGYGKIYIAGVASMLDVVLTDHADLDARYLRADAGFINTNNCSTASIWIGEKLNTLANGNSNIYYYHNSPFKAVYMNPPGATLNMTDIPPCLPGG